jgi:hypothetical protein
MSQKYNFPDFNCKKQRKTSRETLFKIGCVALKACNVPEQINFLGFNYNIANKLKEEICKLDEKTALKAIEEIRKELEDGN